MRVGLGWRKELGAGILSSLEHIDVLEVMAEEFTAASAAERRALRFLRAHVPLVLHATSLGLASPERVDSRRLDALARVVEWLEPEFWSEHLAFVRAGATEVGHLAAPPRNGATLQGLVRNVEEARRVTGSLPLLENVASLVEPPLSSCREEEWLHAVLAATGCSLLLDLHNVYANASNFGFDAEALVAGLPVERIGAVHVAGGRAIEGGRILDDHLHEVPDAVYALLSLVPAEVTVILERDGNYPPIEVLLAELERVRARPRHTSGGRLAPPVSLAAAVDGARATRFLASLYTDADLRRRFAEQPYDECVRAGFSSDESRALAAVNPEDLALAARSYERKRNAHAVSRSPSRRTA